MQIARSFRGQCRGRRARRSAKVEIGPRLDRIRARNRPRQRAGVRLRRSSVSGVVTWKGPTRSASATAWTSMSADPAPLLAGCASGRGRAGEQVVVQVHDLVGVAVMPCTGQPEIDVLDSSVCRSRRWRSAGSSDTRVRRGRGCWSTACCLRPACADSGPHRCRSSAMIPKHHARQHHSMISAVAVTAVVSTADHTE